MTEKYRPQVYGSDGTPLVGIWSNTTSTNLGSDVDWNTTYNKFTLEGTGKLLTDKVYVAYKKTVPGGSGVKNVVNKILRVEFDGKEASFFSIDEKPNGKDFYGRDTFIVDNSNEKITKYTAWDQEKEAAARVVEFQIKKEEITTTTPYTYTIDDSDFGGRKVMGVISPYTNITKIEKTNQDKIKLTFLAKQDTTVKIALDGNLIKYKKNSRTLVSEFLVAKTIKYEAKSSGRNFSFFARNDTENTGIVRGFLNKGTDNKCDVFVDRVKQIESVTGIGTPKINVTFSGDVSTNSIIEIPVLMTYQPTENETINIWYECIPYQGLLSGMIGSSATYNKTMHRISDWKMFSTTLSSSYLDESGFNTQERKTNTTLNAIDRLPGGIVQAHEVVNNPNNKAVSFSNETIDGNTHKHMRFHDGFINLINSASEYDSVLNDLINEIVINKNSGANPKLQVKRFGEGALYDFALQGVNTSEEIKRYDGAACLVLDEFGETYLLVMGSINGTTQTKVNSTFVDLFKVDNAPLQIPRKIITNIDDFVSDGGTSPTNQAPTDITLSATTIAENAGANATVGTLSATDPDAGNTFTYSLVAGTGDTDNASFNISGSTLRATNSFDYETKNSYSIRIQVSDGALTYAEAFTISVTNVNEGGGGGGTPTVNIGDYIQLGKYNDAPILWRVINKESDGNPILLADRILTLKSFDVKGNYHTGDMDRVNYGSNYYKDSNIRQWLNSSSPNSGANTIDWIQNDPIAANIWGGYNPYNTEKGFLADGNFTTTERGLIKPYTHKVVLAFADASKKEGGSANHTYNETLSTVVQNYDTTAYYQNVTDNIFLLSVKQLKEWVYDNRSTLGTNYHVAKPTSQAVTQHTYKASSINSNNNWDYWLNSPYGDYSYDVREVVSDGRVYNSNASNAFVGVRPALQLDLSSAIFTSGGTGTSSNPYVVSGGS